jgi:hypothetical protein
VSGALRCTTASWVRAVPWTAPHSPRGPTTQRTSTTSQGTTTSRALHRGSDRSPLLQGRGDQVGRPPGRRRANRVVSRPPRPNDPDPRRRPMAPGVRILRPTRHADDRHPRHPGRLRPLGEGRRSPLASRGRLRSDHGALAFDGIATASIQTIQTISYPTAGTCDSSLPSCPLDGSTAPADAGATPGLRAAPPAPSSAGSISIVGGVDGRRLRADAVELPSPRSYLTGVALIRAIPRWAATADTGVASALVLQREPTHRLDPGLKPGGTVAVARFHPIVVAPVGPTASPTTGCCGSWPMTWWPGDCGSTPQTTRATSGDPHGRAAILAT